MTAGPVVGLGRVAAPRVVPCSARTHVPVDAATGAEVGLVGHEGPGEDGVGVEVGVRVVGRVTHGRCRRPSPATPPATTPGPGPTTPLDLVRSLGVFPSETYQ